MSIRILLRRHDFRLLFGGLVLSMFGDSAMLIVLSIWVKSLTGSNGAAGLTFLFMAASSVLGPLGGWVVDRVRRRPFLVAVTLASALVVLPLLLVRDSGDVWIIYAVATGYGVSFLLVGAALNSLLKEMLPEELLADANGVLQTVKEALRLIGPLIGAGVFAAFGGAWVAVLDAATFVGAAVAIWALRLREEKPARPELHWWREVSAGFRHLFAERVLLHVSLAIGGALLVIGFSESLIFAVAEEGLHRPPAFVGVIVSVQGGGAVLGGLAAAVLVRRIGEVRSIVLGLLAFAAGLTLMVLPTLPPVLLGAAVAGTGLPVLLVGFVTVLQRRTPLAIMGRVSAAAEMFIGAPQTISIGVGAVAISLVDFRILLGVMVVGILVSAVYLWLAAGRGPVVGTEPAAEPVLTRPAAVSPGPASDW